MEIIKFFWDNPYLRYPIIIVILTLLYMFFDLYISHKKNVKKGVPSTFLWFKYGGEANQSDGSEENKTPSIIGKNVNTGVNHGKIGDN